jgi:ankyrin repeat protein
LLKRKEMGAGDGVLGHFSVLNGKSYQALLPESSPLFCAVVSDNCELLETELSADPGIALRVYNVLEWSSDGSKPEQGTDSSSITVKVRTLLHVAALAGAQGVAQLLLSRGADPLAKSSDGQTPVSVRSPA